MKPGRLVAVVIIVASGLWIWRHPSELKKAMPGGSAGPATSATSATSARDSQLSEAAREAEKSSGSGITENMSPEQVRGVLGSPDEVESFTTDAGKAGERWTYRQARRVVVFENGVAVSVQPL